MKQNVRIEHSKTILLIGSGRLAKHLQHWNSLLEKPNTLLTWDRSQDPHALVKYLNQCHIVWLAIRDSAIIPFYETHLAGSDIPVVHFSGALTDRRLSWAHPLMSFPEGLLAQYVYHSISFAIGANTDLDQLLPGFKNSSFIVSDEHKPLYHALCVVAGNFPQLLWNEVDKSLAQLQIPDLAFQNYLSQVLQNFLTLKEKSLTGPLVRNDHLTINKNMASLNGTKLQTIYAAFVKEFSS
ncbi:MAG: hypothetical protein A2622_06545 [Bdellovibrionales bacterium RIFCSPHIGHO2_01_FULL_40_29]|nr:MAG: hypothetical protein A2622_06545 [Bdellovibrionales bacterium RIFCSPHIGHO2_01_FULL_40_29]OFZ35101.1 MAG: hypothetical protein A3D17_06895 [Bdellovibrionales bacterium RIFCSPHIGHO2_02_FULL_40_15]